MGRCGVTVQNAALLSRTQEGVTVTGVRRGAKAQKDKHPRGRDSNGAVYDFLRLNRTG